VVGQGIPGAQGMEVMHGIGLLFIPASIPSTSAILLWIRATAFLFFPPCPLVMSCCCIFTISRIESMALHIGLLGICIAADGFAAAGTGQSWHISEIVGNASLDAG
jgi:hypothetical protein